MQVIYPCAHEKKKKKKVFDYEAIKSKLVLTE